MAAPNGDRDWPAQTADTIERVVGSVRDKTAGPAISAGRAVVYGVFAGDHRDGRARPLCIAAVRALDVYLPSPVSATTTSGSPI